VPPNLSEWEASQNRSEKQRVYQTENTNNGWLKQHLIKENERMKIKKKKK